MRCIARVLLAVRVDTPAAADLYRWVDPETGSVKFSSYPPPWFGDAAKEARAPKVEVIPAGGPAPAIEGTAPDTNAPPKPLPEAGTKPQAPAKSSQEDRRKLLLKQIAALGATLAAVKPEARRAHLRGSRGTRPRVQLGGAIPGTSPTPAAKKPAGRNGTRWSLA